MLGRSSKSIYKWEHDPGEAKVSDLAALCRIYSTSLDVIIVGSPEPQISAEARRIAVGFDSLAGHLQQRWLMLWQVFGRRGVADPVGSAGFR